MFWRLVTVLFVPECCTPEPPCPLQTLLNTASSTTLLTNTHTAVYSHSCSLLTVTARYNRPMLLAWPKYHQSGSHCVFLPGHHVTRSLLQYSKHRQYLDRRADFIDSVTLTYLIFVSPTFRHKCWLTCESTCNVSTVPGVCFSFRTLRTAENVRVPFFFKMYHSLSNVQWSQYWVIISVKRNDLSNVP